MRDDRERLLDMLEAIQKIEQYAHDEAFSHQNEDLLEVWMIHPFLTPSPADHWGGGVTGFE